VIRETRVRRIGRATIGSAIVFGASLTLWLSQRPEEKLQQTPETIPWPNVSWVIVTTTSTTLAETTTSVDSSSTTLDPNATTTTVEVDESTSTVSGTSTTTTLSS
jgi:hypothetical protein